MDLPQDIWNHQDLRLGQTDDAHTYTHLVTHTHTPSFVPYLLRDLVKVEELEML